MTVVYRTSEVRRGERRRYWRNALSRTFVPLEVQESAEQRFFGELASNRLGDALLSELWSRPQACVRSEDTILREGGNSLLQVGLLLGGRAEVTQDDRTASLAPGGLVIYETGRSFRWAFPDADWDLMIVTFPRAAFGFSTGQTRQLTARDLSASGVAGGMLAGYLRELRAQAPQADNLISARLGETAADLVTTTLLEGLAKPDTAVAIQPALLQRVIGYIEDHLADPGLSPAAIAEALYISRRYLYKIFTAAQGRPVLEWIHARRLEQCRRDLLNPALAATPVARVAARWGIADPAQFSRTFHRAYGSSPSQYRQRYGPPASARARAASRPGLHLGAAIRPNP